MKYFINLFILLLSANLLSGQIRGNGNFKSQSLELENLRSIDVQLNAELVLDFNQKEVMVITADENVIDFINVVFQDGNLRLDQKEWIEPSKLPVITIGSPNLKEVYQGTHSSSTIVNVKGKSLVLAGNVGKIQVEGQIADLYIQTQGTDLDLRKLEIGTVHINGSVKGRVEIDQYNQMNNLAAPNDRFDLVDFSKPAEVKEIKEKKASSDVKYIKFEIKNNSFARHSYYVKGPNGRGGTFSYGFSMMPQGKRDENWSIGTKVYKEGYSGKLTELITIKEGDEGKVLDLFK